MLLLPKNYADLIFENIEEMMNMPASTAVHAS
jgi:hypothetical protein